MTTRNKVVEEPPQSIYFEMGDFAEKFKKIGALEKEVEIMTRERDVAQKDRDHYKLLFETAKTKLDELNKKQQETQSQSPEKKSSSEQPQDSQSPQKPSEADTTQTQPSELQEELKELRERLRVLEDYTLTLDWMSVPYPRSLSYLFTTTKGTTVDARGRQFTGELIRGVPNGKGSCRTQDGRLWEGTFLNGEPHGRIRYHHPDKTYYEDCIYTRGVEQGLLTVTFADGMVQIGCYKDGKAEGVMKTVTKDGRVDYASVHADQFYGQYVAVGKDLGEVKIWDNLTNGQISEKRVYTYSYSDNIV